MELKKRIKVNGNYISKSSTYSVWVNMRSRCDNKKVPAYKNYGGRGISYCPEWKKFSNFYNDMGERPGNLTLDRIDNNKGYCKENCCWVSREDQANNTRANTHITFKGKTLTFAQWCKLSKLKPSTIRQRYYSYGWGFERSLFANLARRTCLR